jgi:dTDP-4-amino-4,6-dideoxygalactose transaminase
MTTSPGTGVPLCDVHAQYRLLQPQLEATLARVLASGQVILGPEVAALEREIAEYCGVAFGVGCASGTDALSLALAALEVGPGDEVILPTFTFFATVGSVCRAGARPVFVDIDPTTYNLDVGQVADRITPRTRALLPVHLFGQCADMEPLWQLAERHDLLVIEDLAQSLGAAYQNKRAGSLGAVGCLSFYPSKNLGAYGDAGMVVTHDPHWDRRLRSLRVHGMGPRYHHKYLGWNARLDEIQAALLRVKLPHLDGWLAGRRAAAARYDDLIARYDLGGLLTPPRVAPGRKHTYNQYVVRVAGGLRDGLAEHLESRQIGCAIYYPIPLHLQECLAHLGHREGDFPVSERAAREVLALPIYPELTAAQQEQVIGACAAFLHSRAARAA